MPYRFHHLPFVPTVVAGYLTFAVYHAGGVGGKTSLLFWILLAISLAFLIADIVRLRRLWVEFRRMSRAEFKAALARARLLVLFAAVWAVPLAVQHKGFLPGETYYSVFLPGYLAAVGVVIVLLSRARVFGTDNGLILGAGGAVLVCLGVSYGLWIAMMQDTKSEPQVAEATSPASTTAKQIICRRHMVDGTPQMICLDADGAEVGGASIRVVRP